VRSATQATSSAPAAKFAGRPTFSTSRPPSAIPAPSPRRMKHDDHVKASVAY